MAFYASLVAAVRVWFGRPARSLTDLDPRHALGRRGEELAARHLRRLGRKVLYRNFRARGGGEVDLVCRHGRVLVFVEVKTRSRRGDWGRPSDAVTKEKERLIARGALAWLKLLGRPDVVFRFDIVEVYLIPGEEPEVRVLEAAFTLPMAASL